MKKAGSITCPFELPIEEIEKKIQTIKNEESLSNKDEILRSLYVEKEEKIHEVYNSLNRWDIVQIARHPDRPKTPDIIAQLIPDHIEFHGDRLFRDDPSVMGAMGTYHGKTIMMIGHNRGSSTKEKIRNQFGMASPEGYHKALRLMQLAEKFHAPIVTLIDTQGAYPGIQAEEMGQSAAIAGNLKEMFQIRVPIVSIVIGEGGSGGALGIGIGNAVLMMQYSIYSVISPEGCASILWRDPLKASKAAEKLQLTAQDLMQRNLIDQVIPEPLGGAHRNPIEAIRQLDQSLHQLLLQLIKFDGQELLDDRYEKFRDIASISF
ncbi:MAG TPA: acetyl-CoA carboxylase carboxyltransferase subunit alpha [Caldisericia bacterium]|nr:acetyl-CoA carboxylase carboxyltransferase subunit alpha [Caldisericia bacterium]HXK51606.1 acetyl-CoA carboxylase carboxyltransferase subunit alpha [Caldisericia bacterium]